jgi:hypothetical protein
VQHQSFSSVSSATLPQQVGGVTRSYHPEFTGFISGVPRRSVKDWRSDTATSVLPTNQLYHADVEEGALPGILRDIGAGSHIFSWSDKFWHGPGDDLVPTRRLDPVVLT